MAQTLIVRVRSAGIAREAQQDKWGYHQACEAQVIAGRGQVERLQPRFSRCSWRRCRGSSVIETGELLAWPMAGIPAPRPARGSSNSVTVPQINAVYRLAAPMACGVVGVASNGEGR